MVDVAHDRDDRRARLQRLGRIDVLGRVDVDVALADALDAVAELGDEQLGRVLVDGLGERDRHAHLEQRLDEVGAALGHAVGELLDRDRLGNDDVADLLGRGPASMWWRFSFSRARRSAASERARLSSSSDKRAADGELAAMALASPRPRLGRAGSGRRGRRRVAARTAGAALLLFLVARRSGDFGLGGASAARCASSSALSASLLGGSFLGLAILFGAAALFLALLDLGALLAAARFLERREARFLGLAQQAVSEAPCGAAIVVLRGRLARGAARRSGFGAGLGASATGSGLGASGGGASPGRPRMRRFLTSTTTVFERPWLKLCLTLPVSTVRLRPSGGRVPSFGFSVWSAILFLRQNFFSRAGPQGGFSAFQTTIGASESPPPRKRVADTRSGGGIGQGDMYHILAPKCHGQDSARLREYHPLGLASADAPRLVEPLAAVLAGVGGMDEQVDLARARGVLDPLGAVDEVAGARLHAEPVERGLAQRGSVRSPRSAGTLTSLVLNARCSAAFSLPLALASSSSARATPIHAPRPGARARTSGATVAVGPEREPDQLVLRALAASEDAGPLRDVRSSLCLLSDERLIPGFRIGGLLGLRPAVLVLEPVGAGGHDDLVALLFAKAVFGEDPALVLGAVARLAGGAARRASSG